MKVKSQTINNIERYLKFIPNKGNERHILRTYQVL